jgi:hypothetical protein
MQGRIERRKYKRFQVPIGVFVVFGPDSTKLGRIVDVSMVGLGFHHIDRKEPLYGLRELDLFLADNGFCLKKVGFQTIWDLEVKKGFFGFWATRRSGLQFGELTYGQRAELERFILNYTTAVYLDHPDVSQRPRQRHGLAPIGL